MAITDETRHHLYQRLEQVLGPEEAHTLMQHLPPVGWADVATKHDLDQLATLVGMRFDAVDQRFDAMETKFEDRLTAGLSQLETRLITALGDFKDDVHNQNQTFQKQLILVLVAALLTVIATAVGLR